jgi:hypothetical protein
MLASLRTYFVRLHWLLLALLTLPAIGDLLTHGLPARFDRGLHIMRLAWLDQHIRQGTLFPRWIPEMMLGRGYPLFDFYGAGVYYLSEIFYIIGLNLSDASVATLIVLILLAGYGMFLWARDLFVVNYGQRAARASLVAAHAYFYDQYFVTVNIYQRGAIAEATAQALMPWVLWSVRRIFTSRAHAHWATVLALLLATLVFSHTLMLLIFPPLLAGYVMMQWLQLKRKNKAENGASGQAIRWAIFGLVTAICISAFFWLPLILERDSLSKFAYGIVRGAFLPRGQWTWDTFVAKEWLYTYARPPRLGLVQLLLGTIGALMMLVWRRTGENGYFLFAAIVAGALVGSWTRPLWESSEILLSIQSPWRLLTVITLILAIFTGAIVAYLPFKRLQPLLAIALMGLIIYTNLPRLEGMPFFSRTDTELSPPMLAQLEYEQGVVTGGEGSTFVQEFRPRWASRSLLYTEPPNLTAPPLELQPLQGNAYTTVLKVTAAESAPLRFNQFYFPGWQVRLDNGSILPAYPTTNLGLLTVDLPRGTHQLTLTWTGTLVQRIAGIISIITLALLAGLSWWQGRRKLAVVPLALLGVALAATFARPALANAQTPTQPLEAEGVRLLGYRTEQSEPTHLYLHPYWYVLSGSPNPNLQAHWQLQDETGAVRSEMISGPYYNASTPRTWPPGTLVEDAYSLPLPPGLPAGSYTLTLQLEADGTSSAAINVGTITLSEATPRQEIPMMATDALFDDEIRLAGFAAPNGNQPATPANASEQSPAIFKAGEDAIYRLYWRAAKTPTQNYHSYIHLIDSAGNAIYHSDQLPGPWFRPPKGWDTYYLQRDTHVLEIPSDAPGGLYWPSVGLYEIRQMNRMALTSGGQPVPGDVFRLPPIKVVGAPTKPPIVRAARFDDGFRLLGYDLDIPREGLHPGTQFQVTLYYRSDAKTDKDYTRFFHLYNPDLGLAAQVDSPPQGGINPTWSWVPGETIVDTVTLQVAEDAPPGEYRLFTGFYDAQANGARLDVQDEAGQSLPDSGVILQTVMVQK